MYLLFSILMGFQIFLYSFENFNLIMKLDTQAPAPTPAPTPLAVEVNGPSAIAVFGNFAYITNLASPSISRVNTTTDLLDQTFSHPSLIAPYNIVLSADGKYAYIANYGAPMTILDTTTGTFYPTKIYGNSLAIDHAINQLFIASTRSVAQYQYSSRLGFFSSKNKLSSSSSSSYQTLDLFIFDVSLDHCTNPNLINTVNFKYKDVAEVSSLTFDLNYIYIQNQINTELFVSRVHRETLEIDQLFLPSGKRPGNNGLVVIGNNVYSSNSYVCNFVTETVDYFANIENNSNAIIYDGSNYLYVVGTQLAVRDIPDSGCPSGQATIITPTGKGGFAGTVVYKLAIASTYPYVVVEEYAGFNCPQALSLLPNGSLYVLDGSGSGTVCSSVGTSGQLKKIRPTQINPSKIKKSLNYIKKQI